MKLDKAKIMQKVKKQKIVQKTGRGEKPSTSGLVRKHVLKEKVHMANGDSKCIKNLTYIMNSIYLFKNP